MQNRASSIVDGAGLINGREVLLQVRNGADVQKQGINHHGRLIGGGASFTNGGGAAVASKNK